MSAKEILEMIANFAVALAVVFAGWALILNAGQLKLQRRALQASLFDSIRKRISDLEDQLEDAREKNVEDDWVHRLLSAFEIYAFYVNHGFFDKDMSAYYAQGIETYCGEKQDEYPRLKKYLQQRKPPMYSELEEYYRNIIGKTLPF